MLKGFLDAVFNLTDPRPNYIGERCLLEKNAVGGCDRCAVVCPHQAIELGLKPEVLEHCTGCGLCVQACPSGALEYDLVKSLTLLKNQGTSHAKADAEERVASSLKCSKVLGDGATIECLGRVSPALLLSSSAWGQQLTLLHNDCASCKLGGETVLVQLEQTIATAREYKQGLAQPELHIEVLQVTNTSTTPAPTPALSRREALRSFGLSTRENTAKLIPEKILPGVETKAEAPRIPEEWAWRKKALRPTPEPESMQHWAVPSVNENCIFCPVCMNVCPTTAIVRERQMDGTWQILLEPEACTGCNACVVSCPPSAMKLEPQIPFAQLSQTVLLREGESYS